jgi:A/G-specific adenine glycosylase
VTDKEFQKEIYRYFKKHGRLHLPWRGETDPYKILVSEIMLQQTQAGRVVPKYEAFIKRWDSAKKLAKAPNSDVLSLWSGLGYNRRALNLKRAAEAVETQFKGVFPKTKEGILALPGVGPYTAGAILAFAFNQPEVMIETNIRSVYIHFYFPKKKKVDDKELLSIIERTMDRRNPRNWYAALMDYGAILKATNPNPSRRSKHHAKQSKFKGSLREVRGAVLKLLLKQKKVSEREVGALFDAERAEGALRGLTKDGLIKKVGNSYTLI